jgi:hypothetical protein
VGKVAGNTLLSRADKLGVLPGNEYVDGLVVVYCNFAVNGGYWHAQPGHYYLCDCTSGNLNFKVTPSQGLACGSVFAAKIVGGAGTFAPTFHAATGELISGLSTMQVPQSGQGRIFTSGVPSSSQFGPGWVSQ